MGGDARQDRCPDAAVAGAAATRANGDRSAVGGPHGRHGGSYPRRERETRQGSRASADSDDESAADESAADDSMVEDSKESTALDAAIYNFLKASEALEYVGMEKTAIVSLQLANFVVEAKKKKIQSAGGKATGGKNLTTEARAKGGRASHGGGRRSTS